MGAEFFWNPAVTPPEIDRMLHAAAEIDSRLGVESGGRELVFVPAPAGELGVTTGVGRIEIAAGGVAAAARGVGLALAGIEARQRSSFSLLGVMIDCSRNKVFTVDYLKRYLVWLALTGCNTAMLYTEET